MIGANQSHGLWHPARHGRPRSERHGRRGEPKIEKLMLDVLPNEWSSAPDLFSSVRSTTMFHRLGRIIASMVIVAAGLIGVQTALGPAANADACYTWDRTLRQGDRGADVEELQERVAAYHGRGGLVLDGVFGPATDAAVKRFQQEYGLAVDGIAGSQTFGQIYDLQDADCTPAHFSYSELNKCNSTWAGGRSEERRVGRGG